MKISENEFKDTYSYVLKETGIVLDNTKEYLIKNRLIPLVESLGLSSMNDLLKRSKQDRSINLKFIDAISTNETSFFRDLKPFDLIKMHLAPQYLSNSNTLTIWSAASSTGQEAYSTAMVLDEILVDPSDINVQIYGTDISSDAVQKANRGEYSKFELSRGISENQKIKYFTQDDNGFKIIDSLRSIVQFSKGNLLTSLLPESKYNIVMCRNVAIYFSQENKRLLIERIHKTLKPSGALIIGSTESIFGIEDLFKRESFHNITYYVKR